MKAILTFHSIDNSGSVLSYPVRMFQDLIKSLLNSSTPLISLADLRAGAHGIVISFDDGMASVHENALPVLRDCEVPTHLFLTTGAVGRDNSWPTQPADATRYPMMTWDDLDACVEAGMLIDGHTNSHPFLTRCSDQQIVDECETADTLIERRTGRQPTAFAYPYGVYDARVVECIRPLYDCAVTTALDFVRLDSEAHLMPRLDTYYLQKPWLYGHLSSVQVRAYIGLRKTLRRIRGSR